MTASPVKGLAVILKSKNSASVRICLSGDNSSLRVQAKLVLLLDCGTVTHRIVDYRRII